MATKFDVVIVGARCAGAATALLLARAGARVLVVDKGVYGSDTVSTHALMRGAVLQLTRWGVLPAVVAAGTPPVRSTTFSYTTEDTTVAIEPRHGVDALYAPRRTVLDRILVDAAMESGVEFEYGVQVRDIRMDGRGRVRGIEAGRLGLVEAGLIVGADGLHSSVARLVGAWPLIVGHHRTGVLYGYWENLPADGFYWGYRASASVGVIPTNGNACLVFVCWPSQRFEETVRGDVPGAYRRVIREAFPDLDEKLAAARPVERIRGFGGHIGFIRKSAGSGWALVGDAAYFKDPLTAHGITDALRDAEFLARAILRGTTEAWSDYETTRLELSKPLFDLTDKIVSFAYQDAELQALHRAFSGEMNREVKAIAAWGPMPRVAPALMVV
jgi:flavin-dependent dehydrogenase